MNWQIARLVRVKLEIFSRLTYILTFPESKTPELLQQPLLAPWWSHRTLSVKIAMIWNWISKHSLSSQTVGKGENHICVSACFGEYLVTGWWIAEHLHRLGLVLGHDPLTNVTIYCLCPTDDSGSTEVESTRLHAFKWPFIIQGRFHLANWALENEQTLFLAFWLLALFINETF